MLTAAPAPVRLLGVSAQTSGRTAALLIEATDPVAYAVSRPDPLTLLVDLRNVNVGDAANQVARGGVISGVTLEQQTAIDGKSLARVRVTLASPTSYRVRSARNTIRVELEGTTAPVHEEGTPAAVKTAAIVAARDDGCQRRSHARRRGHDHREGPRRTYENGNDRRAERQRPARSLRR